jgi:antitoxin ParD1/3/4
MHKMPLLATEVATMISKNVSLPDPMGDWIDALVSSGRYASSSEYIRDLIRRDQEHREFQVLQTAITKGIESGEPSLLDTAVVKQKARAKAGLNAKNP